MELNEFCPKLTDDIRKRRVTFYDNLERMKEDRISKMIHAFFENRKIYKVNGWVDNRRRDLKKWILIRRSNTT